MIRIKVDKILSYQVAVYKNGYRSFRTKAYQDYAKEISCQLDDLKKFPQGDLKATIHFNCKNRVVGDLENITKIVVDILEENGIFKNDRQIIEMDLTKSFGHDENIIEIEIKEV